MTATVQCVPHDRLLGQLIASAKRLLWLCSPFVTADGVEMVLRASAQVRLITKATAANLNTRALDAKALLRMLDAGAEVRSIPNLHAKIYLIDGREGVVTSSNLTGSGLYQNVELGLYFSEEDGIYKNVSDVFERFWLRSEQVTVEGLERLSGVNRVATFDRGVWTKCTPEVMDEPLLAAPAIGFLEIPENSAVFSQETTPTVTLPCNDISPIPDESGDLFGVLPKSSLNLIEQFRSVYPPVVQVALNTLALTSPICFRSWLASLPESDVRALVDPANAYPYKSRVVERIIREGSPLFVVAVVRAISIEPSNESQFLKYSPILKERLVVAPHEWGTEIAPLLLGLAREVATSANVVTATGKNFARPNLDRLCALLTHPRLGTQFQADVTALYDSITPMLSSQKETVPGFQIIRRTRECMGDAFRDWAFAHFASIKGGAWDGQLSSLMSLFKELSKISLHAGDNSIIQSVAVDVQLRLDAVAVDRRTALLKVADEWEKKIDPTWLLKNRHHLLAAREDLAPLGQQAIRSTGRWVSLYGQWVRGGHAPASKLMKGSIDWLTTYLTVRKALRTWIDTKGR